MKVLVADDEVVSRRLLEGSLARWGYDVVVARDGLEASEILLAPDAPMLAVLDWMMPCKDGVELCQEVRQRKIEPYTYIILLTAKHTKNDVIQGLEAGADDYIVKPFDPPELKVRMRTGKRILYLQDQLIRAREALRDQATRDQLTGLWNRATILGLLGDEINRADREQASLAVIVADLDNFKRINDTHGHAVGDEVLRQCAQAMQDTRRRYDAIGRYGGEEFLIVLPGCDTNNALSHAERLRAAVSRVTIEAAGSLIHPTISVGVAVCGRHHPARAFELVQAADTALYRAKRAGRDRVELGSTAELQAVT
jgi:diguanylate cyclase (GGDEF)-like protein